MPTGSMSSTATRDRSPRGLTGGSRALPVGGSALHEASLKIIDKGKQIAANLLEASAADIEFGDGEFRIVGTDRHVDLFAVAEGREGSRRSCRPAWSRGSTPRRCRTRPAPTFPNGCHIAEVEIDPDSGMTTILRYTVVDDFGAVINPMLLEGQVHGGVVQGIGQALLEETVYDEDNGQLLTGTFMDYAMPRADNLPNFSFTTRNVPCKANPLGVKGAGEAGAVGSPPARDQRDRGRAASQGRAPHRHAGDARRGCGRRCTRPADRTPSMMPSNARTRCVARRSTRSSVRCTTRLASVTSTSRRMPSRVSAALGVAGDRDCRSEQCVYIATQSKSPRNGGAIDAFEVDRRD